MHPDSRNSTIYNSQDLEATQGHINKWLYKDVVVVVVVVVVCVCMMEYYLAIKEWNSGICTNADTCRQYYA